METMKNQDVDKKQTSLQRRRFLLTVGATTAGAAAVVAGVGEGSGLAPQVLKQAGLGDSGQGYTSSEHVRNYYRTTRV